jgi:hypothetical protein
MQGRSIEVVTLRQGLKPHGFFCLSSVRDALRNAAWPRLIAHRSGGGKARRQRIHSDICSLGGAMPVGPLMPCAKGRMAHNLRLASWRRPTPASFDACPGEYTHQGGGFSLCYFSTLLHFLKPYILMSRAFAQQIAWYIWNNAVAFLPQALRLGTRTLFSFQGAIALFYPRESKPEMQGLKPTRNPPNHCHSSGVA